MADIKKTVAYYEENFGFKLIMTVPVMQDGIEQSFSEDKEYVYTMMQKDSAFSFSGQTHLKKMSFLHRDCQSGRPFRFTWTLKESKSFTGK